jgi:hypothetical protein
MTAFLGVVALVAVLVALALLLRAREPAAPLGAPAPVAQPTPPPAPPRGPLVRAEAHGLGWLDAGKGWVLLVLPALGRVAEAPLAPDERPVVAMLVLNHDLAGVLEGTRWKHHFQVPADACFATDPGAPVDRAVEAPAEPATVFLPPDRLTIGTLTLEALRGRALRATWRGGSPAWVIGLGLRDGALLGPPLAGGLLGWAAPPDDRRAAGEVLPLLEALRQVHWFDGGDPAAAEARAAWATLGVPVGPR